MNTFLHQSDNYGFLIKGKERTNGFYFENLLEGGPKIRDGKVWLTRTAYVKAQPRLPVEFFWCF